MRALSKKAHSMCLSATIAMNDGSRQYESLWVFFQTRLSEAYDWISSDKGDLLR
jgi:hypothetical protein